MRLELRAYDLANKKMLEVDSVKFDKYTDEASVKVYPYNDYFLIEDGNIVIMQSTGLKDNLNDDIFEGDIILINNKYVRYVLYSECESAFVCMRYIDENTTECLGTLAQELSEIDCKVEVIGNIYENKELLRGCYETK